MSKWIVRLFEIIPGFSMWLLLLGPIILSFWYPDFVMALFIMYAIYWLIKAVSMAAHLIAGYITYKREMAIDWRKRLDSDFALNAQDVWHLIIVATYKEELLTLRQSINAIVQSDFPLDKTIVVLATEERDHDGGLANFRALKQEFASTIKYFWNFEHPKDIPGEVIGKGGNITHAGKQAWQKIEQMNIDPANVLVTTLDADHRVDKKYLACLTYKFLETEDATHHSFQPLPMFFNNIWEVPLPMRILALGSSFWQLIESVRDYRLRNFAAHAQPLSGLLKTDFWATNTIVEDGHQYWRSFFAFNGNYGVVPIFVPIYQDAVLANSYKETFRQQYLQKRRWAWGVSDFPFVMINSIKNKKVSLSKKIINISRVFEGNLNWSTTSLMLAVVAWSPIWLGTAQNSVLAFNFPLFYSRALTMAAIGLLVTLSITTLLLPPVPKHVKNPKLKIALEWLLTPLIIPFTNVFFGAFPAVESQTRLMLGKYLNKFNVTPKKAIEIPEDRHA